LWRPREYFFFNRRFLRFDLNVNIKNVNIIYYIRKNLGFGNIRFLKFLNTVIVEFSVQDNIYDLLSIVNIFNGNLRCTIKEQHFKLWYNKLEVKFKKLNLLNLLPKYENNIKNINLHNSWLSGYIDSRALFYARWHKSKKLKEGKIIYLSCIFWHLNDDLLLKIKEVIHSTSKIEYKIKGNLPLYKIVIESFNEKNKIIIYLNNYSLKTIKKKKYKCWKNLLKQEEKYLKTGKQDIEEVQKLLIKFIHLIKKDEELKKL